MIALALALLAAPPATSREPAVTARYTEFSITRALIIRIPARRSRSYAVARPMLPGFAEHKGPHCIDAGTIGGAAVTAPDSVDFILRGGKRVRARLEDECPALDYYSGFYFQAPPDGKLCAGRDAIHTRSGGDCTIDRFRALTPVPPPPSRALP